MRIIAKILLAACLGTLTLAVFPGLTYVSIATHGVPASFFLLMAYGVWFAVRRRWPHAANVLLAAILAPVAFVLIPLVFVAPLTLIYIVGPTLLADVVRRTLHP